ncbi:ankyrin repeat domain-containing protein [Variovorax humicola]|uniref:Ankyrin repeat domain-containing protein n=1 Tax=Variovorax humicola TaxID=1769758 RepID=A0ABU8WAP0_9BURK
MRRVRHELADAAKRLDWTRVLTLVADDEQLVNSVRPEGRSGFTPLHQAAYGNAPLDVVHRLISMNAARSVQNSNGERPIDVADRRGHQHLLDALAPHHWHKIPNGILRRIEENFHAVIAGRVRSLIDEHRLRLPQLELLLELERPRMWFAVPGMYGGFSYRFETFGVNAKLVSESWSRMEGGSGQRHEINSAGSVLVEEGFV